MRQAFPADETLARRVKSPAFPLARRDPISYPDPCRPFRVWTPFFATRTRGDECCYPMCRICFAATPTPPHEGKCSSPVGTSLCRAFKILIGAARVIGVGRGD